MAKESYRKIKLFDLLVNKENIKATCIRNYRAQDGGAGGFPYLGMAQFVTVKYEVNYVTGMYYFFSFTLCVVEI